MSRYLLGFWVPFCLVACGLSGPAALADDGDEPSGAAPIELFNQRIMPIFRSAEPSSCIQCHLSSVELKNYILPSHEKTFVSLRDQGLIDLQNPGQSKILALIQMGEDDLDEGARLIHADTRRAEYEAFASWIKACCQDESLRQLPPLDASQLARPEKADEVIRHGRRSRLAESFTQHIWSQRMRCFPCHTPHEIKPGVAGYQQAVQRRQEYLDLYGEAELDRISFFRESPEATMHFLIEASRNTPDGRLPLLNLQDPKNSLIVLKPLAKIPQKDEQGSFLPPSYRPPVSHMGGLKMHKDDQSYKAFVAWIKDYANVVGDRYAAVDELPQDNWQASTMVLRMTQAPEDWATGTAVQFFIYSWDADRSAWEDRPIAFTQGTVTPRKIVNGALFLLKSPEDRQWVSVEQASLPAGRYLVKTYVDSSGRLADDPTALLGDEQFCGQVELSRARWQLGFPKAETFSGKALQRD